MNCYGWESSVSECSKNVYPSGSCSQLQTVGVICKDGKTTLYRFMYTAYYYRMQ